MKVYVVIIIDGTNQKVHKVFQNESDASMERYQFIGKGSAQVEVKEMEVE